MTLAQAPSADRINRGLLRILDYVRDLEMPTRADFVADVQGLSQLEAVVLLLGGVALLALGFKYFKLFVILNGAALGGLVGMYLGATTESTRLPAVLGLGGAVLLGALAYPAIKSFVCLMGAAAGGVLGYGVWNVAANAANRPGMLDHAWAGGLVGAVAVGMLAWVAFRAAVMIFTSVQGSLMVVAGGCSLLLAYGMGERLQSELTGNAYVLPVLIGVPAGVGFAFQYSHEAAKIKKKRQATEKPPV